LPKDDAKLNYNQILFEYPWHEKAIVYKVFVAFDTVPDKKDFSSSFYKAYTDKSPGHRIEGLPFGKKYKWYVETTFSNGEKQNSEIHHFSVLNTIYADTSKFRTTQNYNKKEKITDGLIWCDQLHCALDRKGKLVWFIPALNKDFKEERQIRDFRIQNDGTLTFISEPEAYHTDRDLNIIWKGPNTGKVNGDSTEFYHHAFELQKNGNYMVMGNQFVELERMDSKDTVSRKVEMATLIEYNPKGDIVWSWKMTDHFPLDLLASGKGNNVMNPHGNSFFIDKEGKYIYAGFRDISRIIKIEKATGKIVASYGEKLNKTDTTVITTDLFRLQHDATLPDGNTMMVLNNNDVAKRKTSSVEIFTLPDAKNKTIKPIWSFKFDFDTLTTGRSLKMGGIEQMENGNLLVNEGAANRIFEVTKNKEVLWDLMIFKKDNGSWSHLPQYNIDFTRSLYAYYFIPAVYGNPGQKGGVVIFNKGDYADSYLVEVRDEEDKVVFTGKTAIVKPEAKTSVNLKIPSGKYTIKIRSVKSGLLKAIVIN
jgi:hypothetical protein